jgi:hypothetical protein
MRSYKTYILTVLIAISVLFIYLQLQDILGGEERRVRRFILQGEKAVESKDIFSCANMVSMNYHDRYGNDRQTLISSAREVFGYYKSIFIDIQRMKIKLDDSKMKAEVTIVAQILGEPYEKPREGIFEGEKGEFCVRLIKEGRDWKVIEIEFFEPITIMGQQIS